MAAEARPFQAPIFAKSMALSCSESDRKFYLRGTEYGVPTPNLP